MVNRDISINQLQRLTGHRGGVYALARALDGNHFLSAGGDGLLVQWDLQDSGTGKVMAKIDQKIFSLVVDQPTGYVYMGTFEGELIKLHFETRDLHRIKHHGKPVFGLKTRGEHLFTLGGDGFLSIWKKGENRAEISYRISHKALRSADFSAQGLLAVGCSDHAIRLFAGPPMVKKAELANAHARSVFSIHFLPDGRLLSGGMDAHLVVWDRNFEALQRIPAHLFTINAICRLNGLGLVATGSRDKSIRIWDEEHLRLIKVLDRSKYSGAHTHSVNDLLWIEDKRLLISAGDDRALCIWHIDRL